MSIPTTEELLSRAYDESVRLHAELEQLKGIAEEATELLCSIGAWGLHPGKQDELWDRALRLKARLDPEGPSAVFLTEHGSVQEYKAKRARERPVG